MSELLALGAETAIGSLRKDIGFGYIIKKASLLGSLIQFRNQILFYSGHKRLREFLFLFLWAYG